MNEKDSSQTRMVLLSQNTDSRNKEHRKLMGDQNKPHNLQYEVQQRVAGSCVLHAAGWHLVCMTVCSMPVPVRMLCL